jgi:3-oxoadipate CoA-transferase alpha subunit
MIDKFVHSIEAALEGIGDGATIMVGGFGAVGQPHLLSMRWVSAGCGT